MNTKKVVVGGVIAGIVLVVIDFILNGVIFADRMKAEMDAFKPGLSSAMEGSSAMTVFIICDLVMGLVLVWTYAAIRPRFGPGPKTAVTAALMIWIVGGVLMSNYLMIGMMSMGSWWMYAIAWLVNLVIATMIGARFYTEEGAPAMAAA
jgi:hypothetical protein